MDNDREYSGDIIRIFGKQFVKNNKNKCNIIYKNKKYKLSEYCEEIDNNYNHKDLIKFKLEINNIKNMSNMFDRCYHLYTISENIKLNNILIFINNCSNSILNKKQFYLHLKKPLMNLI